MRIAVIDRDRCHPKKCNYLCVSVCPLVKTGTPTITVEEGKVFIDENTCIGCGICVKKCPFKAITIVNLPEAVGTPVHSYGRNGFRLFGLPYPGEGVVGILGPNGTGKTTALRILSGELVPNLGRENTTWEDVIRFFRGKEIQGYLERLREGKVRVSVKPQNVELIPHLYGEKKVSELVARDTLEAFGLKHLENRKVKHLSGGELQMLAIAAAYSKKADLYFYDEPSSYLDIKKRFEVAAKIKRNYTLVVEHDLAVLDYLSDQVFIVYGKPGAYGIFSGIKSVRNGINEYIEGYLREENVRIREKEIRFEGGVEESGGRVVMEYGRIKKKLGEFELEVEPGDVREGEVIGIIGENGIGKTTFVRLLSGEIEPDEGEVEEVRVSVKPQYLFKRMEGTLEEHLEDKDLARELDVEHLMDRDLSTLSGGELQRAAIAICLSKKADVYFLDEPSAFLDVEQRIRAAAVIRRRIAETGASGFVVEHDFLFLHHVSSRVIRFSGTPGRRGRAHSPQGLREGLNEFLKELGITFRRDPQSGRPRANKPGSQRDREQRKKGVYYMG